MSNRFKKKMVKRRPPTEICITGCEKLLELLQEIHVVCTSLPACLLKLEFKYLAYRNSIVSWNYQSSDFWYFLLLQDVFSKENNMWDFYRKPRIYIVGSLRKLTGIGIAFILPDPHICSILCKTMTILKSNNICINKTTAIILK